MILRDARPEERQGLEDLQRRASLMWEESRPYLLANPDVIELPLVHIREGRVRVVEMEDVRLGFSVLLYRDGVADLDGLFVEPACWGRGVGRLLVEDAAARAHKADLPVIEVVANSSALGFYARLGFAACGMVQTPLGLASRLRRSLEMG